MTQESDSVIDVVAVAMAIPANRNVRQVGRLIDYRYSVECFPELEESLWLVCVLEVGANSRP